jgi:inosose dehydratase
MRHFHFKDFHPEVAKRAAEEGWDYFGAVRHGIFCELGKGEIDFPALINELNQIGYRGWGVVEQDVLPGMGSPKESADATKSIYASWPVKSSARHGDKNMDNLKTSVWASSAQGG